MYCIHKYNIEVFNKLPFCLLLKGTMLIAPPVLFISYHRQNDCLQQKVFYGAAPVKGLQFYHVKKKNKKP